MKPQHHVNVAGSGARLDELGKAGDQLGDAHTSSSGCSVGNILMQIPNGKFVYDREPWCEPTRCSR